MHARQTILSLLYGLAAVIGLQPCLATEGSTLYTTSFEEAPLGSLDKYIDGDAVWSVVGDASITNKFKHSGTQSLHFAGGDKNTINLLLKGPLKNSRGMRFRAERWTSASPFIFLVHAKIDGTWKEVADLSHIIQTGKRFRSDVILKLPNADISQIRLECTAPEGKGALIDDFRLLEKEPIHVSKAPEVATAPIKRLLEDKALFVSGTKNTHTFRIPAIITAKNGDLIATCDARRKSGGDLMWVRDIDIAIRRSTDNGKTWSNMELICDFGDGRPASDPSLILDHVSGEIFCLYNYMDQDNAPKEFRLYIQSSKDHGKTWSEAQDITDDITPLEWRMDFKFITSGRGVQTLNGEYLHTLVRPGKGVHVFGSKDQGRSWYLMNETPIAPGDESKIIELTDGRLMINSRINGGPFRTIHTSGDAGKTWESTSDQSLVDPGCNASILRYTSTNDGYKKNRLLFCNANSFKGRKNLSVRISYDEGETWSDGKVIDDGASAYSSLTICKDGSIGILYEPGYSEVRFTSFTLEDLTDGKDQLSKPYRLPGRHAKALNAGGRQGFDLPIVDLDKRADLQVLVDKEKGQYLGHPSTILLEDGQTILCAYPKGHGSGALILKKSTDGGKSWGERLPTPVSWATSREVPTFYHTVDADGKKRILMFSGMSKKNRMAISEDDGKTFSELIDIPNQRGAIVVMSDLIPLNTGSGHYMATYHHRAPKTKSRGLELYTTFTQDGGLTWSNKTTIHDNPALHLCEGGFIRSPDGKQIALLLRENSRRENSQIMFSQDEGKTWTTPRPMPSALCGDRHQAQEIAGNRLLIQFRDRSPNKRKGNKASPTEGDWVGWVGTWDDLEQGREGQYRIRFKDNKHGWDTTYPAAERLADGTLVCTTYGHFDRGEKPYILSFRFKIDELDQLAEEIIQKGQPPIANSMGEKSYLYDPDNPKAIRKREQ